VHTVAAKDVPRLKELMLKFISESNELMRNSPPEDMVVLLCDLFRV
jgi:hypothetical protein